MLGGAPCSDVIAYPILRAQGGVLIVVEDGELQDCASVASAFGSSSRTVSTASGAPARFPNIGAMFPGGAPNRNLPAFLVCPSGDMVLSII